MIIKSFNESNAVDRLTALLEANPDRSKAIEEELRKVRSGIKGEREAAHYIDKSLAHSQNWAILHGLRIETSSGVVQIDHLLINRLMVGFILETKNFSSGLKINEQGEFLGWSNYKQSYYSMASPLMQLERNQLALTAFLRSNPVFPARLGMQLIPDIQGLVLINPSARLIRPEKFDTSKVMKADQFFEGMQKEFDKLGIFGTLGKVAQMISSETLKESAGALARHHRPIEIDYAAKLGIRNKDIAPQTSPNDARGQTRSDRCTSCQDKEIQYGKFGYYWKCRECGGNSKIELPGPGKLRKEGQKFFYAESGQPETLFHTND